MSKSQENKNEKTSEGDEEIRRLVEERRNTTKDEKHKLKELSKRIKKCIRERKRAKRQKTYNRFLKNSEASKEYHAKHLRKMKRTLIPKVKNDKGETIMSRKGIAKRLW